MPRLIIVAQPKSDRADRRTFHLKERFTSADVGDPHVAAQLVERIGWALADAEDAESGGARRSS